MNEFYQLFSLKEIFMINFWIILFLSLILGHSIKGESVECPQSASTKQCQAILIDAINDLQSKNAENQLYGMRGIPVTDSTYEFSFPAKMLGIYIFMVSSATQINRFGTTVITMSLVSRAESPGKMFVEFSRKDWGNGAGDVMDPRFDEATGRIIIGKIQPSLTQSVYSGLKLLTNK